MEYVLKTDRLTKSFGGKTAVNQVDMHVQKGAIYGFIGRNGAGKTTLMRMAAGLAAPDSGSLELFGAAPSAQSRMRVGCAIETPALYPGMTARQNLEVTRRLLGIPQKERIDEVLEIVGLQDTGKKKARHFSMGMKQRMAIATALMGNPDFLILDEPINGLDPTGIKDIRDLLLRLNREQDITILVSSHILGELAKIATWYGIINEGILVDEFTAEELRARCRRCLKIKVDRVEEACRILETVLGTKDYDVLEDHTIRVFDLLDQAGKVNGELAKNDVMVESIVFAGQDLEGYFMELMGVRPTV